MNHNISQPLQNLPRIPLLRFKQWIPVLWNPANPTPKDFFRASSNWIFFQEIWFQNLNISWKQCSGWKLKASQASQSIRNKKLVGRKANLSVIYWFVSVVNQRHWRPHHFSFQHDFQAFIGNETIEIVDFKKQVVVSDKSIITRVTDECLHLKNWSAEESWILGWESNETGKKRNLDRNSVSYHVLSIVRLPRSSCRQLVKLRVEKHWWICEIMGAMQRTSVMLEGKAPV